MPSIEQSLERDYDYSILAVFREALGLSFGQTFKFFTYGFCYTLVMVAALALGAFISAKLGGSLELDKKYVVVLDRACTIFLLLIATAPFVAGMSAVGISGASGLPVGWGTLYGNTKPNLKLLLIGLFVAYLGAAFMAIPHRVLPWAGPVLFLYLQIIWLMAIPLIVDRNIGPLKAMGISGKAIRKHRFKAAALVILLTILLWLPSFLAAQYVATVPKQPLNALVAYLLAAVVMSWALSLTAMVIGILYRIIFGPAQMTVEQ